MLKKIIVYRGQRLKMRHTNLLRNYSFLLMAPVLVGLGLYYYFRLYPLISKGMDFKDYRVYLEPVSVTLGAFIIGVIGSFLLIRTSVLRQGFFLNRKKKQMLARFLKGNNFVEKIEKKTEKGKKIKEKFTKVYYRPKKELDIFTFEIGNKFQRNFLEISKDLENLFLADLINIEREMGFVSFSYLIDNIKKRLNFEDVKAENGRITIMKGVEWFYKKLPHMLIAGGTGGGKTMFIYALINAFGQVGRVHIADPKKSDLSQLAHFPAFEGLVVSETLDIFEMLEEANELMDKRYLYMLNHPNFVIGEDFEYYGLKPEFYIIDEFAALMSELENSKDKGYTIWDFYALLTPLVLKARQAGIFLIIATQRAGTDVIKGIIRDNLSCKVSLGILSEDGYGMLFGSENKNKAFVNKPKLIGRGYINVGTGVPVELYSPFFQKSFNPNEFWKAFPAMPFSDLSEVKINETDKELLKDLEPSLISEEAQTIERNKQAVLLQEQEQKKALAEELAKKAGLDY